MKCYAFGPGSPNDKRVIQAGGGHLGPPQHSLDKDRLFTGKWSLEAKAKVS